MNRMYNQTPYNQFTPNSFPVQQQPVPYNNSYYRNNPQQMPPPYPLQQSYQPTGNYFRQYPNQAAPPSYRMAGRPGFNSPPQQEKKGFLSKLFRNSNKQPPAPTAQSLFSLPSDSTRSASAAATAASSSGGVLQNLVNPANLTSMLNNTQKVLQAAESIGPLVQQYGPMVKNIPSVWKAIQGLTSKEGEQQSETTPPHSNIAPVSAEQPIRTHRPIDHPAHIKPQPSAKSRPNRQYAPGESIPRLFI